MTEGETPSVQTVSVVVKVPTVLVSTTYVAEVEVPKVL